MCVRARACACVCEQLAQGCDPKADRTADIRTRDLFSRKFNAQTATPTGHRGKCPGERVPHSIKDATVVATGADSVGRTDRSGRDGTVRRTRRAIKIAGDCEYNISASRRRGGSIVSAENCTRREQFAVDSAGPSRPESTEYASNLGASKYSNSVPILSAFRQYAYSLVFGEEHWRCILRWSKLLQ